MIGSVETNDPNFNWRVPVGKLWANDLKRKLFEKEMNFAPLITGSGEDIDWRKEAQVQSGHVESYHDEFVIWAIRHLGLEKEVRVKLLEKPLPAPLN